MYAAMSMSTRPVRSFSSLAVRRPGGLHAVVLEQASVIVTIAWASATRALSAPCT
jgi:hypothetical protein